MANVTTQKVTIGGTTYSIRGSPSYIASQTAKLSGSSSKPSASSSQLYTPAAGFSSMYGPGPISPTYQPSAPQGFQLPGSQLIQSIRQQTQQAPQYSPMTPQYSPMQSPAQQIQATTDTPAGAIAQANVYGRSAQVLRLQEQLNKEYVGASAAAKAIQEISSAPETVSYSRIDQKRMREDLIEKVQDYQEKYKEWERGREAIQGTPPIQIPRQINYIYPGTTQAFGKAAVEGGAFGAVIGGGVALAAGVLGPQALIPEELITVPIAAGVGAGIGASMGLVGEAAGTVVERIAPEVATTPLKIKDVYGGQYRTFEQLYKKTGNPAYLREMQKMEQQITLTGKELAIGADIGASLLTAYASGRAASKFIQSLGADAKVTSKLFLESETAGGKVTASKLRGTATAEVKTILGKQKFIASLKAPGKMPSPIMTAAERRAMGGVKSFETGKLGYEPIEASLAKQLKKVPEKPLIEVTEMEAGQLSTEIMGPRTAIIEGEGKIAKILKAPTGKTPNLGKVEKFAFGETTVSKVTEPSRFKITTPQFSKEIATGEKGAFTTLTGGAKGKAPYKIAGVGKYEQQFSIVTRETESGLRIGGKVDTGAKSFYKNLQGGPIAIKSEVTAFIKGGAPKIPKPGGSGIFSGAGRGISGKGGGTLLKQMQQSEQALIQELKTTGLGATETVGKRAATKAIQETARATKQLSQAVAFGEISSKIVAIPKSQQSVLKPLSKLVLKPITIPAFQKSQRIFAGEISASMQLPSQASKLKASTIPAYLQQQTTTQIQRLKQPTAITPVLLTELRTPTLLRMRTPPATALRTPPRTPIPPYVGFPPFPGMGFGAVGPGRGFAGPKWAKEEFGKGKKSGLGVIVRSDPLRKVLFSERDVRASPKWLKEMGVQVGMFGPFYRLPTFEEIKIGKRKKIKKRRS